MMHKLLHNILDYLLPKRCATCDNFVSTQSLICHECWPKIHFVEQPLCTLCGFPFEINTPDYHGITCPKCISHPPQYDCARSLIKFDDMSRKMVHHFKYYDKTYLAKYFAKMLISRYKEQSEVDMIIPVPMHRFKRILRLYNPPQILAQQISKIIHTPCNNHLLLKTKWSKSQTRLTSKERHKNLKDSFTVKQPEAIFNKKILLIDDVMTTGTTANICAKELKKAGARTVNIFTIARTL